MAEFEYVVAGVRIQGVCATDATEDVILAAILADLPQAAPGEERRLDEVQVVYTAGDAAPKV